VRSGVSANPVSTCRQCLSESFRRQALTTENSADGAGDGAKVPGSSQGAEATEDEVDIDIDIDAELVDGAPLKEKPPPAHKVPGTQSAKAGAPRTLALTASTAPSTQ
jgi:hypothetical protein